MQTNVWLLDVSKYSTSWAAAQREKLTQTTDGERWPVQSELFLSAPATCFQRSNFHFEGKLSPLQVYVAQIQNSSKSSWTALVYTSVTFIHTRTAAMCYWPLNEYLSFPRDRWLPRGDWPVCRPVWRASATFSLSTSGCQIVSRPVWLLPLSPWVQTGYWSHVCKTSILFLSPCEGWVFLSVGLLN